MPTIGGTSRRPYQYVAGIRMQSGYASFGITFVIDQRWYEGSSLDQLINTLQLLHVASRNIDFAMHSRTTFSSCTKNNQ